MLRNFEVILNKANEYIVDLDLSGWEAEERMSKSLGNI